MSVKISALPAAGALVGSESFPVVQSSITKKSTISAIATYLTAIFQAILVSGTNIKTVNGSSLLGSGNLTVVGEVDIIQTQVFM